MKKRRKIGQRRDESRVLVATIIGLLLGLLTFLVVLILAFEFDF